MQRKKLETRKKDIDRSSTIQSIEQLEGNKKTEEGKINNKKEVKKTFILIKKFQGHIMESTLNDLKEIQALTKVDFKRAICFLLDIGSFAYQNMKMDAIKNTMSKEKEKKETGKDKKHGKRKSKRR